MWKIKSGAYIENMYLVQLYWKHDLSVRQTVPDKLLVSNNADAKSEEINQIFITIRIICWVKN